jgi:hypothetical protein
MDKVCAKYDGSIHVSASPEFKKRLIKESREAGVSISTYVKYVLLEKWDSRTPVNNVHIISKVNERPYRGRRITDEIDWGVLK